MKSNFLIFLTLLCLKQVVGLKRDTAYCSLKQSLEGSKLVMVQILFRHGERNIIKLYPNDINKRENFTGELGDLTPEGKEHEYDLGVWSRKRYDPLFTDNNPEKTIFCESSHSSRVVDSAKYFIAGALPKTKNQTYYENIINEWKPIEPKIIPRDEDTTIYLKKCPKHYDLLVKQVHSKNYLKDPKAKQINFDKIMAEATKMCGKNITNLAEATGLYDTIKTERVIGKKLAPFASNDTLFNALQRMHIIQFQFHTATVEMARLRGYFLKQIVDNFKAKKNNKGFYNVILSAGHDFTVFVQLDILGLFNDVLPPFGSALMFELHELRGKYYVKIFYRSDERRSNNPKEKIAFTASLICVCSLDDFEKNNLDIIPTEKYDTACILKKDS